MNRPKPPDILPEPPIELKQHSGRLLDRIRERISAEGPISFAAFMEMALYEPGLGYYSAGLHKFGAKGDFVTAPELGDVFGACLARQIAEIRDRLGECDIVEIGAGSGKLAAQLLTELAALRRDVGPRQGLRPFRDDDVVVGASRSSLREPGMASFASSARHPGNREAIVRGATVAARRCSYNILERSADLRAVQKQTIEAGVPEHADRVEWLDQPPSEPWQGVIVANEVVDALPVERFCIKGDEIRQICVAEEGGSLKFTDRAAKPELEAAVRKLGHLPDGYRSEINLRLAAWLESVTSKLRCGVALFVDYGYPRHEYYLPERIDGTLVANYRHRAHGDLLRHPGLQDLTAFVDFTALAEAGREASLELLGYTSQAMFLMACGLDEVLQARLSGDAERDMAVNNEVRQLILPGLMGEKFQVMALGRDWPETPPLRGFSFRDLRDRL